MARQVRLAHQDAARSALHLQHALQVHAPHGPAAADDPRGAARPDLRPVGRVAVGRPDILAARAGVYHVVVVNATGIDSHAPAQRPLTHQIDHRAGREHRGQCVQNIGRGIEDDDVVEAARGLRRGKKGEAVGGDAVVHLHRRPGELVDE